MAWLIFFLDGPRPSQKEIISLRAFMLLFLKQLILKVKITLFYNCNDLVKKNCCRSLNIVIKLLRTPFNVALQTVIVPFLHLNLVKYILRCSMLRDSWCPKEVWYLIKGTCEKELSRKHYSSKWLIFPFS